MSFSITNNLENPIPDCTQNNLNTTSLGFYYNACVFILLSLIYAALRSSKEPIRIFKEIPSSDGILNNLNFYNFRNIQGTGFSIFVANMFNSSGSLVPNPSSTFVYQVPANKKALFQGFTVFNNPGVTVLDVFDKDNNFEYRANMQTSGFFSPAILIKDEQILRVFNNGNATSDMFIKGIEFDSSIPIDTQVTFFQNSDPINTEKVVLSKPANTSTTLRRVIPPFVFTRQHFTNPFIFTPYTVQPSLLLYDFYVDQNLYLGRFAFLVSSTFIITNTVNTNITFINNEIVIRRWAVDPAQNADNWIQFVYFDEDISN